MAKFDGLSKGEKEDERAIGLRVRDTERLCGNVVSENQLIARFNLGSLPDIKPVILSKTPCGDVCPLTSLCKKPRLLVIYTVRSSGKGL